jgi:hypothetical protein
VTRDADATRALRELFADDATVLPDRVLDAVVAELPVTRQQRGPWRLFAMPPQALALAGLAAAIAVVVTVAVFQAPGAIIGPAGMPSPTPMPTPTPTVEPTATPTATVVPGYWSAPPCWETPRPFSPPSRLPDPAGQPLPAELIGRQYNLDPPDTQANQAMVMTLRAPDDPHCLALYDGRSTCFTVLWQPNWPKHVQDSAVRGSARIVDGDLVLAFDLVPNDPGCEGTTSSYAVSADRSVLDGIDVPACSFRRFVEH